MCQWLLKELKSCLQKLDLKKEFSNKDSIENKDIEYINMKIKYIKNNIENGFFENSKKEMKALLKDFNVEKDNIMRDIFFNIDLYKDVLENKDYIFYLYKKNFEENKDKILEVKKKIKLMEDLGASLESIIEEYGKIFSSVFRMGDLA